MKMKTFSKLMAIALMAIMTTCLTSCEDERTIPVQGSGVDTSVETSVRYNLSPTAPVETEPVAPVEAYIYNAFVDYSDEIGDYVAVTIMVTNNTGEDREAGDIIGMQIVGSDGISLSLCKNNPSILNDDGLKKKINNGEQMFTIYTCMFDSMDIDYIDITLKSGYVDGVLDSQRFYLTEN